MRKTNLRLYQQNLMTIAKMIICLQMVFVPILQLSQLPTSLAQEAPKSRLASLPAGFEWLQKAPKVAAEAMEDKEILKEASKIRALEKRLKAANGTYPKYVDDNFRFTGQRIHDANLDSIFDLNDLLQKDSVEQREVNLESQVSTEIDKKTGQLVFNITGKRGVKLGQHETSIQALRITSDKEFLHIIDKNGELLLTPIHVLKESVFRSPIPFFRVGKLPPEILQELLENKDSIRFEWLTRGSRPFTKGNIHPNASHPKDINSESFRYQVQSLVLVKDQGNNKSQLLGYYGRRELRAHFHLESKDLSQQLELTGTNFDLMRGDHPQNKTTEGIVKLRTAHEHLMQLPASIRKALDISSHNAGVMAESVPLEDKFSHDQWERDYKIIKKNAKRESVTDQESIKNDWLKFIAEKRIETKSFYQKYRKSIWFLSAIVGTSATVGVDWALYSHSVGSGPAWLLHAGASLKAIINPSLLDINFRYGLVGSIMAVASLPSLVKTIGARIGKKKGLDYLETVISAGIGIYRTVLYPALRLLEKTLRQKHSLKALGLDRNPFEKVSTNSKLGQKVGLSNDIRVGWNNPLKPIDKIEHKQRLILLSEISQQRMQKQRIAVLLGALLASHENGVEVYKTVQALRSGILHIPEETFKDRKFQEKRIQYSRQIYLELNEMKELLIENPRLFSLVEVLRYKAIANRAIEKLKAHPNRSQMRAIKAQTLNNMGHAGEGSIYDKLGTPVSRRVQTEIWTSFTSDYYFSAIQVGVFGARSAAGDPTLLSADPRGVFFSNTKHAVSMAEQVWIYMVPAAASAKLDYDSEGISERMETPRTIDPRARPAEDSILHGKLSQEGFTESAKYWTREAFNLYKVNYSKRLNLRFMNRLKAMRWGLASTIPFLMMGGLSFSNSMLSWAYLMVWGGVSIGIWWLPVNIGTLNHKERMEIANQKLENARARISQGFDTKNFRIIQQGYHELNEIYQDFEVKVNTAKTELKEIRKRLRMSRLEFSDFKRTLKEHYGLLSRLHFAIESKNQTEIASIKEVLIQNYQSTKLHQPSIEIAKNAEALLEYSLQHPPVAKEFNTKFHKGIIYAMAFVTTWIATAMFADILNPEIEPLSRFLDGLIKGGLLYASFYALQKGVVKLIHKKRKKAERKLEIFNKRRQLRSCKAAIGAL